MKLKEVAAAMISLVVIAGCSNYDKTSTTATTPTPSATVQTSSFAIATETAAATPPTMINTPSTSPSNDQPSVLRVQTQTSTASPTEPTDTFPTRVSMTEAQKMLNAGKAIIVDVRSRQDYAAEHIKGAISIPLAEVVARMAELPKDKTIITYCT